MSAATAQRTRTLFCSFCQKSEHEVQRLIGGPGVYICGDCVAQCNQILDAHKDEAANAG
jgi:ATP-dependent Clp protease ATP-binding subunit ClpX